MLRRILQQEHELLRRSSEESRRLGKLRHEATGMRQELELAHRQLAETRAQLERQVAQRKQLVTRLHSDQGAAQAAARELEASSTQVRAMAETKAMPGER
jgi:peptidoglycan hydrolase CwlO-like protein